MLKHKSSVIVTLFTVMGLSGAVAADKVIAVDTPGASVQMENTGSDSNTSHKAISVNTPGGNVHMERTGSSPQGVSTGGAPGDTVIDGNRQTIRQACSRVVVINGSRNKVDLYGACGALQINGHHNTVSVETVGEISVTGMKNQVSYVQGISGIQPDVHDVGRYNTVAKASK